LTRHSFGLRAAQRPGNAAAEEIVVANDLAEPVAEALMKTARTGEADGDAL
jgi:nitrogen regulatory protein PII